MYAIATLLKIDLEERTREIWSELEKDCGLLGIQATPMPHFSWTSASGYDLKSLAAFLKEFVKSVAPIRISSFGLGLFSKPDKVLYIGLTKTRELMRLHQEIWTWSQSLSQKTSDYYSPDKWMPHITIGYHDLEDGKLHCAVEALALYDLHFEITVDRIAVIYQDLDRVGIDSEYLFENARSQ